MSAVVLLGGGGHCRSVIDVIEQAGLYSILGVLEKEGFSDSNLMGYPLLGSDQDLPAFIEQNCAVVITIGQIKTSEPREKLYRYAKGAGAEMPVVVSPRAYLSRHAKVGSGTTVMHEAIVNCSAEIGENSRIGVNAIIGPGVRIGRDCEIGPGAVVEAALIGNGVRLKANSVIGGTGFGLIPTNTGILSAPHFGRVILQDKVSLGSCVCVDRGMFDDTVIGEGSQIDNHVHIGHNVQIGRNCVIAAFGGLSGSVVIEDGVQMGGRVGIADHVRIGQGARLAADAAIMRDIPANETWGGSPAKPFRQWMKETAWLSKAVKTRTRSSDK